MTDVVGHLRKLGLTEYEARAYIATVALGEGTIKDISAESGVPRSRAYDVMERLAEKGMVEAGSSSPRIYRANEPHVASNHLMDDLRRTNDEILEELGRISRKADVKDNPIWTVKGEWAIDHKIREVLEGAHSELSVLCLNNKNLLRHAEFLTKQSESKNITVVVAHQADSFKGLLGKCRIMRIRPTPMFLGDQEGELNEKGFVTKDGKYCIELVIHTDQDDSLLVTREGEGRRAIVITGTILNFFSHQTVEQVVAMAEDVTAGSAMRKKGRDRTTSSAVVDD